MPKMHHFVPKSYLARFTNDEGFLHVFNRPSCSFRRQRPKEVMKINSYYRQDWAPPGVDPNILEKELGEWLESLAKKSIDRLVHCPANLTDDDTATLLTYIVLQRIRVPRQLEMAKALVRNTILKRAPSHASTAIRSGEILLTIKDAARFECMHILFGQLRPWFERMEWEVFEAESDAAFVTTDSPVSLYNPKILPPAEAGLALAGTMVFFPLSSRYALVMRHSEVRTSPDIGSLATLPKPPDEDGQISLTHGVVWSREVVDSFNWKMARLSEQLIVARGKDVLQACATGV